MAETAASGPGMPQLDVTTFSNQIFWLVVAIVVLYYVMSRVALPRVESVLADRRGAITADIAAAEDYKQKAHEAEEAYKKAEADAREEAQRIVEAAKAEMQEALNAQIAKADAEIAEKSAESEKRIREITANAADMVGEVSADVTADIVARFGMTADSDTVSRAVKAQAEGDK